jgi:UDP-GlcNAc:undecaprenyl-phosphate GlcNAc-1-phosphate transferase
LPLVWKLVPAAGLVFITGLVDDLIDLNAWQKVIGQLAAATLAFHAGVRVISIEGQALPSWCSLPLTVIWLVGCTNAFNLIDGIDGLASGVGLFATMTMFVAALLTNNMSLAFATFPLAGCLLAFLVYNFNPASVFLGDCGSLLIGFLLGCYGVVWSQKCVTILGMTAPLMAMAIPLLDALLSIARRFLRNKPLFVGDRGHIHHKLLDRGLTPRRAALLLYGFCGIAAGFSLLASVTRHEFTGAIVILFCAVTWIGVQNLGYDEFRTATSLVRISLFRNVLNAQLELHAFELEIGAATSVDNCWTALCGVSGRMGYEKVTARLNGSLLKVSSGVDGKEGYWQVRVNLRGEDYVELMSRPESPRKPLLVGVLCESIARSLGHKLLEFPQAHEAFGQSQNTSSLLKLAVNTASGEMVRADLKIREFVKPA